MSSKPEFVTVTESYLALSVTTNCSLRRRMQEKSWRQILRLRRPIRAASLIFSLTTLTTGNF